MEPFGGPQPETFLTSTQFEGLSEGVDGVIGSSTGRWSLLAELGSFDR